MGGTEKERSSVSMKTSSCIGWFSNLSLKMTNLAI